MMIGIGIPTSQSKIPLMSASNKQSFIACSVICQTHRNNSQTPLLFRTESIGTGPEPKR
jgi:hypothetical protein